LKKYPNLSLTELKLCALLVLNISSKEIGELTSRSVRTIEFTRLNIRKKMNLPTDENLVKHLILFTEEEKDTDTKNYHYNEKK
jgi:DNA-binding CsgD family transcriptional regulator